ncbi:hypothetical protein BH09ACT7_BH09ACT7_42970 [soil metagenome]
MLAVAVGLAAAFIATGADAHPLAARNTPVAVLADSVPCCLQIVGAPSAAVSLSSVPGQLVWASRRRTVDTMAQRLLPAGVAPERGLQVRTILAARSISAAFPEIHNIGGVRADALRWHPGGLALDVMIPNNGTAAGIALGNEIVAFVLKNADRFAINHVIWRGTFYTRNGAEGRASGHYDHVHVATNGGGYPTGGETYFR